MQPVQHGDFVCAVECASIGIRGGPDRTVNARGVQRRIAAHQRRQLIKREGQRGTRAAEKVVLCIEEAADLQRAVARARVDGGAPADAQQPLRCSID